MQHSCNDHLISLFCEKDNLNIILRVKKSKEDYLKLAYAVMI